MSFDPRHKGMEAFSTGATLQSDWRGYDVKTAPPCDVHWFSVDDAPTKTRATACGRALIRAVENYGYEMTATAAITVVDRVTCLMCLRVLAQRGAKP